MSHNLLTAVTDSQPASLKLNKFVSSPRWRCLKQKSLGLLLFWSCSAFVLGNYAFRKFLLSDGVGPGKLRFSLTLLVVAVFFLCAWFIADVYVGIDTG